MTETNCTNGVDEPKSLLKFFESIPEYDDINHLSNQEFYRKLRYLKDQQRLYYDFIQKQIKYDYKGRSWVDDYKNLTIGNKQMPLKQKPSTRSSPSLTKHYENGASCNLESLDYLEGKVSSKLAVRLDENLSDKFSTPEVDLFRAKSRAGLSSAGSRRTKQRSPVLNDNFDWFKLDDVNKDSPECSRSVPTSPRKYYSVTEDRDCGLTIPQPFKMTVRDEENKIVEEHLIKNRTDKQDYDRHEMFKANPIPIESQIPLYNKIMQDQELRRQMVKIKSKEKLRSQMRLFSFTKREEELDELTKRLSRSAPSLFLGTEPLKIKQFKAKPVPKNLFSNYIYRKMNEDEFYRALQKKIRAEELLKAASLPPSMAKREKDKQKIFKCHRICRDLDTPTEIPRNGDQDLDKDLAQLELDFILATPSPKTTKKSKKKVKRAQRKSSSGSTNFRSHSNITPIESVNRSNLAAVLRIETARKRMEDELSHRMAETRIKDEMKWREKVLRKRPVWQTLAYSHEEDLRMRLQLRRDEEHLRNEEHRMRMQDMLGRVQQQPTLFERQSKVPDAKTREELIAKLYKDVKKKSSCTACSRKNSAATTSSINSTAVTRSLTEIKDEGIQSRFDELFKNEEDAAVIDFHDEFCKEKNKIL